MDFLPEEFDEILNIFRGETEEIIQKMNNNLLQLESTPNNKELLVYLFRDAHSLKGAARMIGFNNIQRLAHKVEDVLGLAKENKICINREIADSLYQATDLLSDLIQQSVKLKKEYYTDNIQKHVDAIDALIKNNNKEIDVIFVDTEESSVSAVTVENEDAILSKVSSINGLLSESYLLLQNIGNDESCSYLETFIDTLNQLNEKFLETSYFDIKSNLKNIINKVLFVFENTKVLTASEILDLDKEFLLVVDFINDVYEKVGVEPFNIKAQIAQKNGSSLEKDKDIEPLDAQNSVIFSFIEKLDYLKTEFAKLETDLSQINEINHVLDEVVNIGQKQDATDIISRIKDILDVIKATKTLPEKEIINILKQSLFSVEQIILNTKEEQDDITLVLQRLDIIKQMIDLNTTVNPVAAINLTIDDTSSSIKKAQDFFNSFETTSIKTLRVDSKKLDRLVNQIGELIIGRIKYRKNISVLDELLSDLLEWRNFNNKSQSFIKYYDRKYLSTEILPDAQTISVFIKQIYAIFQENSQRIVRLNNKILNLQKSVEEEDSKLNVITTQLEEMIKNIRVLPLATIFHMFPRMIRDISKDTGKEIELLISGSETSADKKVIEEIKAPLMHIIRNSIDHGIETPQERIALGKSPKGKIYLVAKNYQNKIIIEIHDDGRGIDLKKIVARALEKGMITAREAEYLSAEQIMNIIFWPGFSTEQSVTELSGRGVGLDIVQTKISQLNGTVKVFSIPGQGTKITIELPISMSTLKAFIVEASSQYFAIPMTSIKNVMWVDKDDIYIRNDCKSIIINEKAVNLFYLSELMNLSPSMQAIAEAKKTVILLEIENILVGIIVDKIHGDQNILQKKLEPPIMKLKNISGVTTLATGEVCLILNLQELYKSTYSAVEKPLLGTSKHHLDVKSNSDYKILIVDDSVTTRELLKNILKHWGYNFEIATNPKEAFDALYKEHFDLILSDLEMPEMDGNMFIEELKNHPKFKYVPIIIISSYDADSFNDVCPAANAFIKKANFNQDYLLDTIEKLLKYE